MKPILTLFILITIISCTKTKYTPIKENSEIKALRLKLEKEVDDPSWIGLIPHIAPDNFDYKKEKRIGDFLYFSEEGLWFDGKLFTNTEFEAVLVESRKEKAKKLKTNKGFWIFVEQDGDSRKEDFVDALVILKKLDMYANQNMQEQDIINTKK